MTGVSAVLCTYNRAGRLQPALDALVAQRTAIDYEVIVVDNNSSDDTADVVRAAARESGGRLRYAFEARQGLSHARNRGIDEARMPTIAFTDDDVRVADDWIGTIAQALNDDGDVSYVGGRVLPRWLAPPPRWLTTAHWSPLALQDYGAAPLVCSRERAICLVGANLAFKREVFDRVGGFAPELGRVRDGIGSTEDHEMQLRVWRAGLRGRYDPRIVAIADVTPDRMVKAYHRRWHRGHGRHCAAMRLRELVPSDMGPMSEPRDIVSLFGSPAFVYADVAVFARRYLRTLVSGGDAFFYANKLRHLCAYLAARRRRHATESPAGLAMELMAFADAYRLKRQARRAAAGGS